jgi:phospholipid/cholesterol/gamma-HCH transport system ATP-binding protein
MNRKPFISVHGLAKSFDGKAVLRGINLDIMAGETVVVLGGSGEGKTVLLRHLNGLLRPDAGEVIVGGQNLNDLSEDELGDIRRHVGMVFQSSALFDSLTVYENVSFLLNEYTEMSAKEMRTRVAELLAMVELEAIEELYPAELSGGMKKRVALARAIALEPKALLYDEPTGGLDPITGQKINLLIRTLQHRLGLTSVVVTHELRSAFMVGDRLALLDHGRIRFIGSAAEVRRTSDDLMREFVKAAFYVEEPPPWQSKMTIR